MASSAGSSRRSRRTKIATTVGALALVGAAGGYGTYAAFTDTTALAGSAQAGTVQLNDAGADTRTINVSGLLPGDAPSACFVVAAPTAGNTQALSVALTTENTTVASTANTALATAMTVGLERVAGTDADFSANGATGTSTTLTRTSNCAAVTPGSGTAIAARALTALTSTPLTDSFTLAPGASQVYRVTVSLPTSVAQAAQGGAASFRLTWTGSAGS